MGDLKLPPYQAPLVFIGLLYYLIERHRPLILTFVVCSFLPPNTFSIQIQKKK